MAVKTHFSSQDFERLLSHYNLGSLTRAEPITQIDSWAWSFQSERLDLAQTRAIVQAYQAHRPLIPFEQRHICDVHKLSILFDCIWYFGKGTAGDFYEKHKIDFLNGLGREQYPRLFCKATNLPCSNMSE